MENKPKPDQASDTTLKNQLAGEDAIDVATLAETLRVKRAEQPPPPKPMAEMLKESLSRQRTTDPAELERIDREHRQREQDARIYQRNLRWQSLVSARGSRYTECRLENYAVSCDGQRVAVELLRDYCDHIGDRIKDGTNIVLIGPAGTGKDHLMMALCHAAIAGFRDVRWQNGTSLWLSFREAIGRDESEATIIGRLTAPDVLAISDPVPPRGPLSDYQAAMLFDVIDSRYSRQRVTWVTLNCASRQEAEDRIGAQVVDRLSHEALVIKCNWPSHRRAE